MAHAGYLQEPKPQIYQSAKMELKVSAARLFFLPKSAPRVSLSTQPGTEHFQRKKRLHEVFRQLFSCCHIGGTPQQVCWVWRCI